MADGSRHSLRMAPESTYGGDFGTAFDIVRHTGTTLALSKESLQSEEIRDDRQISDFRLGARQIGGDITIELSCLSFDKILEAVLGGTWSDDALKAGVQRRSFTIERYFSDIPAQGKPYHRFSGVEFDTLQLQIAANAIATATLGVIGSDMTIAADPIAGQTLNPAPETPPLDSFTGTIQEAGTPIAVVTEVQLNLENGLEPRFVVGSRHTLRPSIGRSNVSGQVTAYFEDALLLEKFINENESSISFSLPDALGNALTFTLPRVKYTGGQPDVSGEGPITLAMPFQALYDPNEETNILIERVEA